jgi:hypothetical protein
MARVIAKHLIKHDGQKFAPGDTLIGVAPDKIELFIKMGAAEKLPNMEPSLKEPVAAWRAFAIEEGLATEAEAAKMKKEEIIALLADSSDSEEEEQAPPKTKGK